MKRERIDFHDIEPGDTIELHLHHHQLTMTRTITVASVTHYPTAYGLGAITADTGDGYMVPAGSKFYRLTKDSDQA